MLWIALSTMGDVCRSSGISSAELALLILPWYGDQVVRMRNDGPMRIGQPCQGGCLVRWSIDNVSCVMTTPKDNDNLQ